jgi:allophanate hydrolase
MTERSGLATRAVLDAFRAIEADDRSGIWICLVEQSVALAAAADIDAALARGEYLPLAGTTCAVKDNIDVAGLFTTAACAEFAYLPERSAPAVQAVIEAGAVVLGKTNLDQFATGLVGTRSPYGICPNAHWPEFVSGGSSSGSAVAVAAGHVDFALGTDTAGSGRIPAACNGIVGIKPTRGTVSATGVVPACRSLDCVTVLARSVARAAEVAEVLATTAPDPTDPWSRARPAGLRPGNPRGIRVGNARLEVADFDGDLQGPARYAAAVRHVASVVGSCTAVDIDPFVRAGRLLYEGAFVAERFEAVGDFVMAHRDAVDPIVGEIIAASATRAAWEVFRDRTALAALARVAETTWDHIDVLVVPSAPRIPTVTEVLAEPIERNVMLGRFTNFVNLLDLCALTLPVPTELDWPEQPPTSLTLIAPAGRDEWLVSLAATIARERPANHQSP